MFGQMEPKRKKVKEELPAVQNGHAPNNIASSHLNGLNRQTSTDSFSGAHHIDGGGVNNFYFDHSIPSATAVSESGLSAPTFGGGQHLTVNSHLYRNVAGANGAVVEPKSVAKKPAKPRKKKVAVTVNGDLASVYPELASKLNLGNVERIGGTQQSSYNPVPGSASVSYEMSPIRPPSHNFVEPLGLNVPSGRPVSYQNGPNPPAYSPALNTSGCYSNGHGWNGNADDIGYGNGRSQRANDLVYSPYSQMSFTDTPWSKMSSPCSSLSQETHQPGISSPRSVTSVSCRNGDIPPVQSISMRPPLDNSKTNGPGITESAPACPSDKFLLESPKKVIRLRPNKKKDKMSGPYRKIQAVNRMCGVLEKLESFNDDLFPLGKCEFHR